MDQSPTQIKKSALIIGGGIAGLVAARELACGGIDVTVLEAKNRFGGRIYTIHNANFPMEYGAEFVHGESKSLLGTIREAGLSIQTVPDRNCVYSNGRLEQTKIWDIMSGIFNHVNPHDKDCSFEEFMSRQSMKESVRKMARGFAEGFDAAHIDRISSHALLRAEHAAEQMNGSRQFRVSRGYSALIGFLEHEIKVAGGILLNNITAQRVRWRNGGVEVLAECKNRPQVFKADVAVITAPVGVLKRDELKFEPSLPEKLEAAREMEFGNAVKIVFHFRHPFWDNFGFIHALDERIPTWWNDSRGPILNGWAGGPKADALLALSQTELSNLGLDILSRIFSTSPETIRREFIAAHYWNWAEDRHVRGAYSYIPVNGLDLPKQIAKPVADTLFFAGEATVADAQTGTVFGALETGLRAAREIFDCERIEVSVK